MMCYICTPWAEISIDLSVASCLLIGHNSEKKIQVQTKSEISPEGWNYAHDK